MAAKTWIPVLDVPVGATYHMRGEYAWDYVRVTQHECCWDGYYVGNEEDVRLALIAIPDRASLSLVIEVLLGKSARTPEDLSREELCACSTWSHFQPLQEHGLCYIVRRPE